MRRVACAISVAIIVAGMGFGAHAGGLLGEGGLVDDVTDTVDDALGGSGSGGDGGLVDIGSGPAGNDAVVNVGIGNGGVGNNVLDVNLGTGQPAANANVSAGSNLTASLNLGGLDLDLSLPGIAELLGLATGGAGQGNGTVRTSRLGGGGAGGFAVSCSVNEGRQVLQIAAATKVSRQVIAGWQRAVGVKVIPVKLCAKARAQVLQLLNASGKVALLRAAAAGDALIAASLGRTRYGTNDVFAVQNQGGQLVVYVL